MPISTTRLKSTRSRKISARFSCGVLLSLVIRSEGRAFARPTDCHASRRWGRAEARPSELEFSFRVLHLHADDADVIGKSFSLGKFANVTQDAVEEFLRRKSRVPIYRSLELL